MRKTRRQRIDLVLRAIRNRSAVLMTSPVLSHQGLTLGWNRTNWREEHPEGFRDYFTYSGSFDFVEGWWPLPGKVTELVSTGQVSLQDLSEALTRLLVEQDREVIRRKWRKSPLPQPVQESQEGYVYVIKSARFYKIGKAQQLKSRLTTHQTSTPYHIRLVLWGKVRHFVQTERQLHTMFQTKRVRGEWFRLERGDLQCIRGILKANKAS